MSDADLKFQRVKIYAITFTAYVAIHTMRMSYSQIKPYFEKTFNLDNFYLGLFDALVYLSLAVGFFLRFFLEGKKSILKSYAFFLSITSLAYFYIPFSSIGFGENITQNIAIQKILPGVSLIIFGFSQFAAWPALLTIISEYFTVEEDGTAVGIWSANGDFGNVVGFGLAALIVSQVRWEVAMIVAASFNLIMIATVMLFVKERNEPVQESQENQNKQEQNAEKKPQVLQGNNCETAKEEGLSKFKTFLLFSRESIKPLQNKLFYFAMALLKSIVYGMLLWIPTFLSHNNLSSYSASVPIVFNAGTVIGSSFLGYFYKDHQTNSNNAGENSCVFCSKIIFHMKKYSLVYANMVVCIILGVFFSAAIDIILYFFLSAIMGFFLGGAFNMLASNQVILITKGKKEDVNMFSTLSMVFGNLMVGIVQMIIGVVLDVKDDPQGEKKLFIILLVVGLVAIVTLLWRRCLLQKNNAKIQIIESNEILPRGESTMQNI